jgi:hypothetical protein
MTRWSAVCVVDTMKNGKYTSAHVSPWRMSLGRRSAVYEMRESFKERKKTQPVDMHVAVHSRQRQRGDWNRVHIRISERGVKRGDFPCDGRGELASSMPFQAPPAARRSPYPLLAPAARIRMPPTRRSRLPTRPRRSRLRSA